MLWVRISQIFQRWHQLFRPREGELPPELNRPHLGGEGRTHLLRPGAYVVRLRAPGFRAVERPITIRPLEATVLEVDFEPE